MKTILSELIDNVHEHGGPDVTGYAALQRYPYRNNIRLVVSDNGRGLMQTIRPVLQARDTRFGSMGDARLLVEMFRQGLSRIQGPHRGCGLHGCALKAMQFKAKLEVRLATERLALDPVHGVYAVAKETPGLAEMKGTHISFVLPLV